MRTLTAVLMIACLSFRLWSNRQHARDIAIVLKTSLRTDDFIRALKLRVTVLLEIKRDEKRIDELKAEIAANWRAA